jgi:hypothetical protein
VAFALGATGYNGSLRIIADVEPSSGACTFGMTSPGILFD